MRPSIELSREECRALLASKTVGRIAFQTGNGLRVLPVNYVVQEDRIVFRTAEHGVIARLARHHLEALAGEVVGHRQDAGFGHDLTHAFDYARDVPSFVIRRYEYFNHGRPI